MFICKPKDGKSFYKQCEKINKSKIVRLFQKFNSFRFKHSKVRNNSILIIEPNSESHSEVLPYFIKYFISRNYKIDIILSPFLNNSKFLDAVSNLKFRKFVFSPLKFNKYTQLEKLKEYKYIFYSSEIIYCNGEEISIFDYFPELNKYKDKIYYVQHHLNYRIDDHTIVLADIGKISSKAVVANPHYFGKVKRHIKNTKTVNFVFVGALEKNRKDYDILFRAITNLINKGITNFHITHIGREKIEVSKDIEKYFSFLGYLDFKTMKKEIENSDFYLMLLNPDIEQHRRYMTIGTSGSFQLVYGLLKPCIIHKEFAEAYGINNCSIVYEDNNKLSDTMEMAINMQSEVYNQIVLNIDNYAKKLEINSNENLDKIFLQK